MSAGDGVLAQLEAAIEESGYDANKGVQHQGTESMAESTRVLEELLG